MRARRLVFAALWLFIATAVSASPTQQIVDRVTQDLYTDYHSNYLYAHEGDDRDLNGVDHDPARDNIEMLMQSFGLTTYLDPFDYSDTTYYNVVGVHTGTKYPDQQYIIGAHYDSINRNGVNNNAPGADDNASGVAGILAAASILSQYSFESTLIFIAFDREEQGLIGSYAYANENSSDDIRGMISLDMIAYNPAGANEDKARVYWATTRTEIVDDLASALGTYGNLPATITQMNPGRSDHERFDSLGFDAALLIEYNWLSNTTYHEAIDNIETLGLIDYDYATRMTKGVTGYLIDGAVLVIIPELASPGIIGVLVVLLRRRAR